MRLRCLLQWMEKFWKTKCENVLEKMDDTVFVGVCSKNVFVNTCSCALH